MSKTTITTITAALALSAAFTFWPSENVPLPATVFDVQATDEEENHTWAWHDGDISAEDITAGRHPFPCTYMRVAAEGHEPRPVRFYYCTGERHVTPTQHAAPMEGERPARTATSGRELPVRQ